MILFFQSKNGNVLAVDVIQPLVGEDIVKLQWVFDDAGMLDNAQVDGVFVGPRKEMITPWSTNAVEITRNMGIKGVVRIERFEKSEVKNPPIDPMLQVVYHNLQQDIFTIDVEPAPIEYIEDIKSYNKQEGLALSTEEITYLEQVSKKIGRLLTDSEIFGFSQVNSEHCRHKIFNGVFEIDGEQKPESLFALIRKTTNKNPNRVVSAYKDNCAFMQGPSFVQFAPQRQDVPDFFQGKKYESVISLKAETHNFPTTVEPFNGAATGSGGEIRDRMAGGKAAYPIAGTAVYMTSYPRLDDSYYWENFCKERPWLYQTPADILIKASNGASDFGNKFGQPLICGSVCTFEHAENKKKWGFDKVIMMAGGVGYGRKSDVEKDVPKEKDKIVLLGGDNYRIGMGGGAVSSVNTGQFDNAIELNAVQRSNPEMQKRAYNAIRAMGESDHNPIITIHDHGAGGHLNCLSELVEETGGRIEIDKLPIGDPTLSDKEIIGNESQERMGLVMKEQDINLLKRVAERERAPMYVIGEITGDHNFSFVHSETGEAPLDLQLEDMFGNPPRTILKDKKVSLVFQDIQYKIGDVKKYLHAVLQTQTVACKDYLTNKVDRSVTGKVAKQQCAGELQLPLNNPAVVSIDQKGGRGIATAIGSTPVMGLVNAVNGSVMSIAEALTNIIWTPVEGGIRGISLSANWMWPCRNEGEDARLYEAVKAASDFSLALGLNIPTGKDSMSMTQKYKDGELVISPGTVIITAAGEAKNIRNVVEPVIQTGVESELLYIDLSRCPLSLGGSMLGQVMNRLGNETPTVSDPLYFIRVFETIQTLIEQEKIIAGHDVSSGGLITTLLEMNFANTKGGLHIDLDGFDDDIVKVLFSENPAIVIQVRSEVKDDLALAGVDFIELGEPIDERWVEVEEIRFDIEKCRDTWYRTSYLLDCKQSGAELALERFENYKKQKLTIQMPKGFKGRFSDYGIHSESLEKRRVKAAIIREKGVNGDREMAWSMYLAGMDVKDVHMTDLIEGRETLEDIQMIVFVGGFSNSDVLGSAKGWAGAFLYNARAKEALDRFYARKDTLSLGVCNGCQLMMELGLIMPEDKEKPKMLHNDSHKFESAFLGVDIHGNRSVMLKSLENSKLGIWVAHGEGKFHLPYEKGHYHVALTYAYDAYPGNPNGSDYSVAGICSADGRHLAMMPHIERAVYPWQWAYYPEERKSDEVTPWIEAFVNARKWIQGS
jgi:phosphoribosylformylglycinamidine synthase